MMSMDEMYGVADGILGMCGRMLSGSKSMYFDAHPENKVVFNANVCVAGGKIWYGDLDVTRDEEKLKELAAAVGEKIFVLREMDARFDKEHEPALEKAVYTTE